jgi:hypothetical protein
MSTPKTLGRDLHFAQTEIADPGSAGTITVNESLAVINLVSAAAETRTLSLPTRQGVIISLHMMTDGGDITLTVASAYNEYGDTTFVFSEVGQTLTLQSFQTSAGVYFWRTISHYGIANQTAANTMTAGSGVSAAETYKSSITREGNLIITRIVVDLTGLVGGSADLDIIGNTTQAANAHFGQITAAKNGTIAGGQVTCLELPTGGADDIDFYSATVGTAAQDTDVTTLTETVLITSGAAWASGTVKGMTTIPPANDYLYIVNGEAAAGTFTAGKFLIELYGY